MAALKHSAAIVVFICCIISLGSFASAQLKGRALIGTWQGSLHVSGISLRIVFNVAETVPGRYRSTMDSPDQGAKGIPVDSTGLNGDAVYLYVAAAHGEYSGRLLSGDSLITGTWSQGGMAMALDLRHDAAVVERKRPQEPVGPFPYKAEDVLYPNSAAGTRIGGTLTLPKSAKPVPAVLLISGSGKQTRDEEILGHKPFFVLADYLTRQGIAVLRVDDRGAGKSTGNFATATTEDFAADVEAGLEYLRTRKEIDPKQIGLIGHSEGGLIAPMVAAKDPAVAWIVLMAGPGIPGGRILVLQDSLISLKSGVPPEALRQNLDFQRKAVAIAATETDTSAGYQKLDRLYDEVLAGVSDADRAEALKNSASIRAQLRGLFSPWMRYFITLDPAVALRKVKCPLLALIGEKDLQVPAAENLAAIESALREGGNTASTVRMLPGLNHLFQTAATGLPQEYSTIEETLSPLFLKTVGEWIVKNTETR
jgi:uncharacterized protein